MTTPSSPPLRPSPLVFREFQKLQENRRKVSSWTKPVIRKLPGVPTWVCHYRQHRAWYGLGLTPTEAYNDWKSHQ